MIRATILERSHNNDVEDIALELRAWAQCYHRASSPECISTTSFHWLPSWTNEAEIEVKEEIVVNHETPLAPLSAWVHTLPQVHQLCDLSTSLFHYRDKEALYVVVWFDTMSPFLSEAMDALESILKDTKHHVFILHECDRLPEHLLHRVARAQYNQVYVHSWGSKRTWLRTMMAANILVVQPHVYSMFACLWNPGAFIVTEHTDVSSHFLQERDRVCFRSNKDSLFVGLVHAGMVISTPPSVQTVQTG